MKVTINNIKEEIKFNAKLSADISLSAYIDEEPIAFRFVKSGWSRPQRYHVLIEWGDSDDTTYKGLMSEAQILDEYGFEVPNSEELSISKIATQFGNDADLGSRIRKTLKNIDKKIKL